MKLSELQLFELTSAEQADLRTGYTSGKEDDPNSKDQGAQKRPTGPKKYYVRGKDKKGADRRWGPFDNSAEAGEFRRTRTDIRGAKTVFE
jgi:hypothetical protein